MFACNYVLHAGHHDILGFSVSYLSIKIKFCREETIPWRTFLHPVWLLNMSTYMFAYILFNPNHIHVTCETCRSTYLRAGFFYDIHGQKWCPNISQPSHMHQFSRYNCLPPRIHPPWHLTQAQSPKSFFLFFVLCSYLGRSLDQADACHMASVHLGFCSIWNTHLCLRLQPHLYPVTVEKSVGRSDGTRQRYKSTHVEPDALVRTRNYCRIKVSDRQRWTHIESPTRLNVIDPDWDYMIFLGNNSPEM